MKRSLLSIVVVVLLVALLVAAIVPIQRRLDREKVTWEKQEELLYLPSGRVLHIVSLGFDQVVADIIFIKMIEYFATHNATDHTYTWLYHMADITTDLDPYFKFPYVFAGLLLNLEANQFDNARLILEKGMTVYPDDWYFPFLLGLNYFFHDGDLNEAAKYFERSNRLEGSPEYLAKLTSKLREYGQTRETTLEFMYFLYNSFTIPEIKAILAQRIMELESEGTHD
ncbi:MAG: hypothetical protein JW885_04445 [Deltaproteobacteria bacterium]|nr:hypothetical protein [Candidatus Zymogenaceae bacterium]